MKLGIPVAHVEAGLRSFDMKMPEEVNRRLIDHVSARLFCPTPEAVANLRREGIRRGVACVGDVMMDAVQQNARRAARLARLPEGLEALGRLEEPVALPAHPRLRMLTDSGGLQKEAVILKTPCVTLRDQTEWVETVAAGANRIAGADARRIARAVREAGSARPRWTAARFYGNGRASERIAAALALAAPR